MKKILITALLLAGITATAQVKVGSNPTTLATDAKFQVEGSTGAQTVILDNGNVGIGTTAPTEKLDVTGSIKMVDGNQAAGAFMVSDANGKATWTPAATALGASASKWTNDAANTRVALTNLSDGTTARPVEKSLFVHDRGSVTINSQRSDFVNDAASLGLGVVDNELTFTASSATAIVRNGIYELSSPMIESGVTLSGFNQFQGIRSDMIRLGATNAGTFNGILKGVQSGYGHHSSVNAAATSETIVGFYARPYSQKGTITNLYDFYADNTNEAGGTVTNRYGIGIDGDTKKNYFMGSVGIGTATPTQKLEVAGRVLLTNGFSATNAALLYKPDTDYMFIGPSTGTTTNGGTISLNGATFATNPGAIILNTPGSLLTELFISGTNGNVGIGTTTPTSKLQVVGLPIFVDNSAAKLGTDGIASTADDLTAGAFYHAGDGIVRVVF